MCKTIIIKYNKNKHLYNKKNIFDILKDKPYTVYISDKA